MTRPTPYGFALTPLIARPRDGGYTRAFSVAAGYDPETVHSWLVRVGARYGVGARAEWTSADVDVTGQAIEFSFAGADVSAADEEVDLQSILDEGMCVAALDALDESGNLLWRVSGPVDFLPWDALPDDLAPVSTSPITIRLDAETTIALTIHSGAPRDPEPLDNATLLDAIEEDAAATRTALGLAAPATYDAAPSATTIRDILVANGMMAEE
jgi:hypothetical protein